MAKVYRRDALERALIHHGIDYSPPEAGGRKTWLIHTHLGTQEWTVAQVHAYVIGLAHRDHQPKETP